MSTTTITALDVSTTSGRFPALAAGPPDGPLVLFLHGFPQNSRCWTAQLEAVADAGYRGVAFDQRGYSPHVRPAEIDGYSEPLLVADALAVADALGADRFHVVGHDWGGGVAWMVAGNHPGRVLSVAVASTPHPAAFGESYRADGDQNERSGYMRAMRDRPRGEFEATLLAHDAKFLRMLFTELDDESAAHYVDAMLQPGALQAAVDWYRASSGRAGGATPTITVPALYVWSDADPALGRRAAESTASQVAGPYRFVVLEGIGHWIPEVAADAFNTELLAHLGAHGGGVTCTIS